MRDYRSEIIEDPIRLDAVIEYLTDVQETPSGIAYQLQMLYTGFEKVAERCLMSVSVKLPKTETYHADLQAEFFKRFEFHREEIEKMKDLLSFRHFARWGYGQELTKDRVEELRAMALELWPSIKSTLMRHMGINDTDLFALS